VNTVIDEERRLAFVNFGEISASHKAAVDFIRPFAEYPLRRRFRTVITSSAGYPLDATYYQTVKGMVGALDALEPGGRLFVASACSQGLGSSDYALAQARLVRLGSQGFLQEILDKHLAAIDEWQTEMQLRSLLVGRISLFTQGLTPEERALTGVEMVDSLEEAVRAWVAECGDRRVAVIPEGPYVVPCFQPA
jgi:lactate racemase